MTDLEVIDVDRTRIKLPYRSAIASHMFRELPHWRYFDVFAVELAGGAIGYGETMAYYTWGRSDGRAVSRALGSNAGSLLWDDSLGAGLQMALFDAVGNALGVPVHELLGSQVRDRASISWWCIDMPPAAWLAECELAIERGYTGAKVKGRPWFDIREQVAVLADELPSWFAIDIDFNDTLLRVPDAVPVLEELEAAPQVSRFETPIPQEDVPGNRRIRAAIDADLALHYGTPPPMEALCSAVVDGFVWTGGASQLRRETAVAATAETPGWLQLVGTDLTATWMVHQNAVLEAARWPAITCHDVFSASILAADLQVEDGSIAVPNTPGLGVKIDRETLETYAIEEPTEAQVAEQAVEDDDFTEFYGRMQTARKPSPQRLIRTSWADGSSMYFTGENDQLLRFAQEPGNLPYFPEGVTTELVPDDGSERWQTLWNQARDGPVEVTSDD